MAAAWEEAIPPPSPPANFVPAAAATATATYRTPLSAFTSEIAETAVIAGPRSHFAQPSSLALLSLPTSPPPSLFQLRAPLLYIHLPLGLILHGGPPLGVRHKRGFTLSCSSKPALKRVLLRRRRGKASSELPGCLSNGCNGLIGPHLGCASSTLLESAAWINLLSPPSALLAHHDLALDLLAPGESPSRESFLHNKIHLWYAGAAPGLHSRICVTPLRWLIYRSRSHQL